MLTFPFLVYDSISFFQVCTKIPGFVYLALGDPLQKRNFYRAGWIRFRDDTDMSSVVAELGDKKVRYYLLPHNMFLFLLCHYSDRGVQTSCFPCCQAIY